MLALSGRAFERSSEMLVREIMTSPAYRVHESASLEAALQTLVTTRVTSLPVVDGGGRLVGIISEADVLREHLAADPRAHMRVVPPESGPLPTAHPHTVREDSDVAELAQTFAKTSWKSVPVVEGDLLLGVVSRSDVIRAMARSDSEIAAEVSEAFAEIGQHAWHADVVDRMVHITGTASERERAAATSIAQSILGVRRVTSEEPQA
jgi:CBS domain-containing protein